MKLPCALYRRLRIAVCAILLLFAGLKSSIAQQAFHYNQYMNNLTPFNPAGAMLDNAATVDLLARSQWAGIEGAPSTFLLNAGLPLRNIGAKAGVTIVRDEAGVEDQTGAELFFAKGVRLSEGAWLSAAVSAGLRNYRGEYSRLDAYDPAFRDNIRETTGTVGLGIMLYNPDRYYIGVSLPRMSIRSLQKNAPEDERNLRNSYYMSGGYLYSLGTDFKIKPAFLLAYSSNLPTLTNVSATMYIKDRLGAGINYQSNKEMAGMLTYFSGGNIRIGYSYQWGFGSADLGSLSNGTHEVSLGFRLGKGLDPRLL